MSEGNWLNIVRCCAASNSLKVLPEYKELYELLENKATKIRCEFARISLQSKPMGILSTLIMFRNKLFAHGISIDEKEKENAKPQILSLIRIVLQNSSKLFENKLYQIVSKNQFEAKVLCLRGIRSFKQEVLDCRDILSTSYIKSKNSKIIPLFPLIFSERPYENHRATLIEEESEIYLLNYMKKSKLPVYLGVGGGEKLIKSYTENINNLFHLKKVWASRDDITLEKMLTYIVEIGKEKIDSLIENNQFNTEKYINRGGLEECIAKFIDSNGSGALFIAGNSGTGKTSAIYNLYCHLVEQKNAILLIKAAELPATILKYKGIEKWILKELGYLGKFEDVLKFASNWQNNRIIIIIDALNEFINPNQDAISLFKSINYFLSEHKEFNGLKIIFTSRSDNLGAFFPNGHLPYDVDEDLYYESNGLPYYELTEFNDDEIIQYAEIENLNSKLLTKITKTNRSVIRTPGFLSKIKSGAVQEKDIKSIKTYKITIDYINKRIGRDKELKRTIYGLVQLINDEKNLILEESEIEQKSIKTYNRLKNNNWERLTILSQLGLIQQFEKILDNGERTWSIALSHDSLFEALNYKLKARKRFIYGFSFLVMTFMLMMGMYFDIKPIDNYINSVHNSITHFDLSSLGKNLYEKHELDMLKKALKNIDETTIFWKSQYLVKAKNFTIKIYSIFIILLVICTLTYLYFLSLIDRTIQQDVRIYYYGYSKHLK